MQNLFGAVLGLATVVLVVPGGQARANVHARPGDEFTLRGEIKVLSVTPFNPAGKDLLRTRVVARVTPGPDGHPDLILTHTYSGQWCRFDTRPAGRGRLEVVPQTCRFKALSSPGTLRIVDGVVGGDATSMTFNGTMDIRWLNYRGTIAVDIQGPVTRQAPRKVAASRRSAASPADARAKGPAPVDSRPQGR